MVRMLFHFVAYREGNGAQSLGTKYLAYVTEPHLALNSVKVSTLDLSHCTTSSPESWVLDLSEEAAPLEPEQESSLSVNHGRA